MGLGFKKSTFFCVRQQERMCYSIPRQRLSECSGPGQPVDRGFSDDRHRESLLSRMRFIPKTAFCRGEHGHNSRNPMFHAETFCTTRQLSSRTGGAGESFPCFGVWGRRAPKDSPAGGRPRLAAGRMKKTPYREGMAFFCFVFRWNRSPPGRQRIHAIGPQKGA